MRDYFKWVLLFLFVIGVVELINYYFPQELEKNVLHTMKEELEMLQDSISQDSIHEIE